MSPARRRRRQTDRKFAGLQQQPVPGSSKKGSNHGTNPEAERWRWKGLHREYGVVPRSALFE